MNCLQFLKYISTCIDSCQVVLWKILIILWCIVDMLAGAYLESSRITFTGKFCPRLVVWLSCFCPSVHWAACSISSTPTSALPKPFSFSTASCRHCLASCCQWQINTVLAIDACLVYIPLVPCSCLLICSSAH